MYVKLKSLIKWPDHDASHKTLPHVFRQYFPRLTAIIDCTEIFIDRPKSLNARAQVYSNYKKHSTVKFLIACTPYGSISFISQAWVGRVNHVDTVRESGFINRNFTIMETKFSLTGLLLFKMSLLLVVVWNLSHLVSQKSKSS